MFSFNIYIYTYIYIYIYITHSIINFCEFSLDKTDHVIQNRTMDISSKRWNVGSIKPIINIAQGWKIVRNNDQLAKKRSSEGNCEILRTIFQPRALSSDIKASRKGVYLFHNPPIYFSRRAHVDRSCIFCGFFRVSLYGIVNQFFNFSVTGFCKQYFSCFPWPIKSLAWTLALFLVFLPSK